MFKLKFALSHFLHQRKAINRHRLHSPFVYRLVDEVIYDFSNKKVYAEIEKESQGSKKLDATDKLLYRLINDAKPATLWIAGRHQRTDSSIIQRAAQTVLIKKIDNAADWRDTIAPDVIFLDTQLNPQSTMDYFNKLLPRIHADTLLIVKNINENMLTKTSWNIMQSHAKVTVSVNLFWLGLFYFRPGKVKEDFLIKF
ncbi:hypothetical protein ABDD95_17365 [Mucilaginibacter sp. PAMB04274]|uniref:hypothetical protein n=1 Tax=Mucilaginibacter sp. PAMB04274 TaxID=3138568 RepID=UPI0031F6F05D